MVFDYRDLQVTKRWLWQGSSAGVRARAEADEGDKEGTEVDTPSRAALPTQPREG